MSFPTNGNGGIDMSLRGAINAKCRDCIYDEAAAGSAAVQIELCASWDTCALWPVRRVRPEGIRVPYSASVCEEQGLSSAMAAFRLAHPYDAPPESVDSPELDESAGSAGEDGRVLPDAGLAA